MNEVLQNKTLYIFDMDGTIYLGGRVFPFAVDFIRRLRAAGKRVLFFTNHASHSSLRSPGPRANAVPSSLKKLSSVDL